MIILRGKQNFSMPRKLASCTGDVVPHRFSKIPDAVPEHWYKQLQKYCLTDMTERLTGAQSEAQG